MTGNPVSLSLQDIPNGRLQKDGLRNQGAECPGKDHGSCLKGHGSIDQNQPPFPHHACTAPKRPLLTTYRVLERVGKCREFFE